jgi:hypothetical protein
MSHEPAPHRVFDAGCPGNALRRLGLAAEQHPSSREYHLTKSAADALGAMSASERCTAGPRSWPPPLASFALRSARPAYFPEPDNWRSTQKQTSPAPAS